MTVRERATPLNTRAERNGVRFRCTNTCICIIPELELEVKKPEYTHIASN